MNLSRYMFALSMARYIQKGPDGDTIFLRQLFLISRVAFSITTGLPLPAFVRQAPIDLAPEACDHILVHEPNPRGPGLGRVRATRGRLLEISIT